jgi:ankyrin repeat protein
MKRSLDPPASYLPHKSANKPAGKKHHQKSDAQRLNKKTSLVTLSSNLCTMDPDRVPTYLDLWVESYRITPHTTAIPATINNPASIGSFAEFAVRFNRDDIITLLNQHQSHGTKLLVRYRNANGFSLLHSSLQHHAFACTKALYNLNPNSLKAPLQSDSLLLNQATPLLLAFYFGAYHSASFILEKSADSSQSQNSLLAHSTTPNGNTAAHLAAANNQLMMLALINKHNPKLLTRPNNNQQHPIHYAIKYHHSAAMMFLLSLTASQKLYTQALIPQKNIAYFVTQHQLKSRLYLIRNLIHHYPHLCLNNSLPKPTPLDLLYQQLNRPPEVEKTKLVIQQKIVDFFKQKIGTYTELLEKINFHSTRHQSTQKKASKLSL